MANSSFFLIDLPNKKCTPYNIKRLSKLVFGQSLANKTISVLLEIRISQQLLDPIENNHTELDQLDLFGLFAAKVGEIVPVSPLLFFLYLGFNQDTFGRVKGSQIHGAL